MYNGLYQQAYNSQLNIDRINNQIAELERLKSQIPQQLQPPTNLTQNFQLAPNNSMGMKYADSIEEVRKNYVTEDTPFFSKDLSIVWIKNTKNEIRTYELSEIIPKDEKDIEIEFLKAQIERLEKGMINNAKFNSDDNAEQISTDASTVDESIGESIKESKSTGISRFSTSKKK